MRVCIVDEDRAAYDSLIKSLPTVHWFRDAETLLGQVNGSGEDAVIVANMKLPGIGGLELIKKLRERGLHAPVILVAADADVPTAVRAISHGAADFLEKPIRSNILLRSIGRAVAASSRAGYRGTATQRTEVLGAR